MIEIDNPLWSIGREDGIMQSNTTIQNVNQGRMVKRILEEKNADVENHNQRRFGIPPKILVSGILPTFL